LYLPKEKSDEMFDFSISGIIANVVISIVAYILLIIIMRSVNMDFDKKIKYLIWMTLSLILMILYNFIVG